MDTIDCPKCECEHEPVGNHEDDAGEMTCEDCGFVFVVEIEYEPTYSTQCKACEFGEFKTLPHGQPGYEYRECVYCGNYEAREVAKT